MRDSRPGSWSIPVDRGAGDLGLALAEEEDAGVVLEARLGLSRSVESSIDSVPVRSLLTKKTAPPPSLAVLSSIIVPASRSVNRLPSM